ncbi:hypothetical protein JOC95_001904 [Bacillus tianshenii]|uniref:Uncharacterized protein n=1 Tax=Sutcliffiella tianshenii TaxID=1463404 RepID=A0ABS2NZC3_9BACI|nr:hypothetical protein [Bacillus tianshenii]
MDKPKKRKRPEKTDQIKRGNQNGEKEQRSFKDY